MELEKPSMTYTSPLPPKQGGFYYREQHLNALSKYFDVQISDKFEYNSILELAFGPLLLIIMFSLSIITVPIIRFLLNNKFINYYEYDFGVYKKRLFTFIFAIYERIHGTRNIFRLHEDYTNKSYGWLLRLWDNFWLMFAASLIFVHTEEHKIKLWSINMKKTHVLISGIDIVKRKRKPEKNTIIIPGFVSSWKGHDILLKALAEVKKQIPDVKLIIAGKKHSDAYFKELTKDILLHDLQDNVELHLDYLTRAKMQKLLKRAKIAVLPYRKITFSAALCDCLDWEIPTITSDILEFRELAPELPKFHIECYDFEFYEFDSDDCWKIWKRGPDLTTYPDLCLTIEILDLLRYKEHYDEVQKSVLKLKQKYDWKRIVTKEAELIYSLI